MATTSTSAVLHSGAGFTVTEVRITWDNDDKDWSAKHLGPKGVEPVLTSVYFSTDPTDGFATNHQVTFDTTNAEVDVVITSQPDVGADGTTDGSVAGAVSVIKMLWLDVAHQDGSSIP